MAPEAPLHLHGRPELPPQWLGAGEGERKQTRLEEWGLRFAPAATPGSPVPDFPPPDWWPVPAEASSLHDKGQGL